jgi:K+-transporting ATPase KdpF subunit
MPKQNSKLSIRHSGKPLHCQRFFISPPLPLRGGATMNIESSSYTADRTVLTKFLYQKTHFLHYLYLLSCYAINRGYHGCCLSLFSFSSFYFVLASDKAFRKNLGYSMEILYWIGGIVTIGLLIYLFIALFKPEIFS